MRQKLKKTTQKIVFKIQNVAIDKGKQGLKKKKKYLSYSSIIYLWIQMSFGRYIFYWNPKHRHYKYPPFFPLKDAKHENTHISRGHNSLSYQFFCEFFFLVTLQVLPFQKFIICKISHRGWRRGAVEYVQFEKNRLKISFLLYKSM